VGPPDGALPAGFQPASITRISLQNGWLLGDAPCAAGTCLALARTRDGGDTWHGVPAPSIAADAVDEIRFANERDGWLFGSSMWATHDGGSTWQQVTGMAGVRRLEIASGRAYAIATGSSDTGQLFTALTGGDAWSLVDQTPVFGELALHGSVGYVMGGDGRVRAVSPSGLTALGQVCADGGISGLAIAGNTTVVALCGEEGGGAMGSSAKHITVSNDGGKTFEAAGDAPLGGTGAWLAAASPTTYVVGAVSGATFIYRSTDGGVTWQTVFDDETVLGLVDLGFTDAKHGVMIMQSEPTSTLLTTSDGGATWTKAAIHD
jgi:photosystem II stability/assembly factor-like uncharacterized protein